MLTFVFFLKEHNNQMLQAKNWWYFFEDYGKARAIFIYKHVCKEYSFICAGKFSLLQKKTMQSVSFSKENFCQILEKIHERLHLNFRGQIFWMYIKRCH